MEEDLLCPFHYFGITDLEVVTDFGKSVDEAKELSQKFNQRGWRTAVLSGADSDEVRASTIERLAGEQSDNALDYIISVDIFSEGVDVPEINQVIMLRPTQSPIVLGQKERQRVDL